MQVSSTENEDPEVGVMWDITAIVILGSFASFCCSFLVFLDSVVVLFVQTGASV